MGPKGAVLKKNIVFKAILRAFLPSPDGIAPLIIDDDDDEPENDSPGVLK